MAKARWGIPAHRPTWPITVAPLTNVAPGISSAGTLDAANEKVCCHGLVLWADGGTHDLRSIRWRSSSGAGLTGTLTVFTSVPSASSGPPMQDGTLVQSVTHTNPAANTNFTSTLTSDHTSLATGDPLSISFEVTAFTSGSSTLAKADTPTHNGMLPIITTFLGGVWAGSSGYPCLTLVASDGTLGLLQGSLPQQVASVTSVAFNTGSAADEHALAWTPLDKVWVGGMSVFLSRAAGAAFDLVLYEGTTVKATKSFDENWGRLDGLLEVSGCFADIELTPATTYYLSVKPTTANSVTIYYANITSGDGELFGAGMKLATRVDAGSWTTDATKVPFRYAFGVVAGDDGAGSSGGMLVHPGMVGGLRG